MEASTNENDENGGVNEPVTPSSKGTKRTAKSPAEEKEVKKVKVLDSADREHRESSTEIVQEFDSNGSKTPKTPKTQKMSKEEREQLRLQKLEEKEKQRLEKERILEEKRLEKDRLIEEKRLEKEKKEKERMEKKLEEDRKKEEKKREIEEKRREAEDKKKKEEEEKMKKKKEEDDKKEAKRKEEEAAEEKKRRQSAKFLNFFSKVEKKKVVEPESDNWYRPFQVKDLMTLAPVLRRTPVSSDTDLITQSADVGLSTYLKSDPVQNRVMVPTKKSVMRAKLFQFHSNRRPPYYGTWRRKPQKLSGRRPMATDEPGINYEVDSDDEWEDEPSDGEECRSDEEDGEEAEDAMSDDGFYVPPCYLSDGEGEDDGSDVERTTAKSSTSATMANRRRVEIESDGEEDGAVKGARDRNGKEDDDRREREEEEDDFGDGGNREERKARLASRAKEWSRRVSRHGHPLVSRCIGPCYDERFVASSSSSSSLLAAAGGSHQNEQHKKLEPKEFTDFMTAFNL